MPELILETISDARDYDCQANQNHISHERYDVFGQHPDIRHRKFNIGKQGYDDRRDNLLKRAAWALIIVGTVMATLFSSLVSIPKEVSAYSLRDPIRIDGNGDFTLANGVISGSGTPIDPYIIEEWEIAPPSFTTGIQIQNTDAHFIIRDSYVHSSDIELYAIVLNNVTNGNVSECVLLGFGGSIQFSWSYDIAITHNEISGAWYNAVGGGPSANITISENNISGRMQNIYLSNTDNAIVTDNFLEYGWNSISLFNSSSVVVTGNTLTGAGSTGIFVGGAFNILVFHNNFVSEYVMYQAMDMIGGVNAYDNGYPSGGNYWIDYTGIDVMSGPNQDVPGTDGIGDTPYLFNYGAEDRYPLMSPISKPPSRPPGFVEARLSGQDFEDVTVSWALSLDDGQGLETVVGYNIYRNSTLDFDGVGYQLIGSVPNGTSEFVDGSAGEGDPNNYFYMVCAVDSVGRSACATYQGGKYTRPLTTGFNLVSSPVMLNATHRSIREALQTVKFDNAWLFHGPTQEWRLYSPSKPGQIDVDADYEMGIWVNVTEDSNFTVAGLVPWVSTEIMLWPGWNLVSFPSFGTTYTVADLKSETGATRVEGFDMAASPYHLKALTDGDVLQTGYGYWVKVDGTVSWRTPVT